MKKIYLMIAIALFILPLISAEVSLGNFKQNTCVELKQICSNCTYNNISSILAPSGMQALGQKAMTKLGTSYNYTYCDTSQIGQYIVNGFGDLDSIVTVWTYNFEITPTGYINTLGFYFLLVVIIGGFIALGFIIKDGWFVVIGGLGCIALGLYSINSGIAGFRDMFLTWGIGLFLIGMGAYLAINSTLEMMGEENNA